MVVAGRIVGVVLDEDRNVGYVTRSTGTAPVGRVERAWKSWGCSWNAMTVGGASSSWSERPGVDVQVVLKIDLVELSGGGAEEAGPA